MRHPVSLLFPTFVLIIASESPYAAEAESLSWAPDGLILKTIIKTGNKNEEKKYLKPQVDVAQTGPCMMINPSQVKIYKGRFQNRQELEKAEFTLDEEGFLWGNK